MTDDLPAVQKRTVIMKLPKVKTKLSLSHSLFRRRQTASIGAMEHRRQELIEQTDRFIVHADSDISNIEETIAFLQARLQNVRNDREEAIRMGKFLRSYKQ